MYVFPGQFVFLTDQYYSDFGDKNISLGHNPSGSNEKSGRPCFLHFPILQILKFHGLFPYLHNIRDMKLSLIKKYVNVVFAIPLS